MPSFCRSALKCFGLKRTAAIPPAEPSTPTSPQSISSSPSDEDMAYINYKLEQYKITMAEKASNHTGEATAPLRKLAQKAKAKICSLLHRHGEQRGRPGSPRSKILFGSNCLPSQDPRNAMDLVSKEKQQVRNEVAAEDVRVELSGYEADSDTDLSSLLGSQNGGGGRKCVWREGPACCKPAFVHADGVEAHHGVIVLEADGLEVIEPREFV